MLYSIGFLISLVALALWFAFPAERKISPILSLIFLIGLGSYLYSVFCAPAAMDVKLINLSRDLIVLAATASFLSFFKSKIPVFTVLLLGISFLMYQYYFSMMQASLYATTPPTTASSSLNADQYAQDGELLIDLKEYQNVSALQSVLNQYNLTARPAFDMASKDMTDLDDYIVVNIPDDSPYLISDILNLFKNNDLVDDIESNDVIQLKPLPAEKTTRKKRQFNVNDPEITQQWALEQLAMDELYTYLKKNKIKAQKTALVAILDTGVDAKHEDIAANFQSIQSKHDTDPHSHGTHCAGIANAVTNNGKGIASFSPNNDFVKVTSVRVLSGFGGGTQQGIINGILEAADAGADVISMSLGAPSSDGRKKAYQKAIDYANKKGAIVLAAAGNSNRDASLYTPANIKNVIAVSAVDENLNKATFSNFVQNVKMGIAAPGVNIHSTIPNNEYKAFNGTSMACPYAAGLVALLKSIKPELDTKEAYTILKKSGKDTANPSETGQFIQPAAAVKLLME